jgi:NADH:ubiquinone oxidoreductase subunit 6 (subunit J)
LDNEILADQHMAHLGARLFSGYLIAVEVAGTLLLVALVGTVAIVSRIQKHDGGRSHG